MFFFLWVELMLKVTCGICDKLFPSRATVFSLPFCGPMRNVSVCISTFRSFGFCPSRLQHKILTYRQQRTLPQQYHPEVFIPCTPYLFPVFLSPLISMLIVLHFIGWGFRFYFTFFFINCAAFVDFFFFCLIIMYLF